MRRLVLIALDGVPSPIHISTMTLDEGLRAYDRAVDDCYAAMGWTFAELVEMAKDVASKRSGLSEFCLGKTDKARVRRFVHRIRATRVDRSRRLAQEPLT